jgi:hypothetical protein
MEMSTSMLRRIGQTKILVGAETAAMILRFGLGARLDRGSGDSRAAASMVRAEDVADDLL